MISLAELAQDQLRPDHVVALGPQGPVTWGELRPRIAGLAQRIRQSGQDRLGLGFSDGAGFLTGLLAAAAAGVTAVVPANLLPRTLAGLGVSVMDESWITESSADLAFPASAAILFQTSGTSGVPKLVARSLGQFEAEARALEALLGEAGAKVVATVPHHHVYGVTFRLIWPLLSGRAFHTAAFEMWEDALSALSAGDLLVTSPAHLARLGGLAPLTPVRRPALVLSAGAPLSDQDAVQARAVLGVAVTEIFGSTEAGVIASRTRDQPDPPWRPLAGVRVSVASDGCLAIHSPWAGAVASQDRAQSVEGGFRLLGRADRTAKIEGKRVALDELEAELCRHPWIRDAALVQLPEGGALGAVVVPTAQGSVEAKRLGRFRLTRQLRAHLAQGVEAAALPRRWRLVDHIPVNDMGKRVAALLAPLFGPPRQPLVQEMRSDGDEARYLLHVPADLYWFRGHFPGFPILPGVVLIHWAWSFARQSFGLGAVSPPVFQVKFKAPIRPDDRIALRLTRQPAKNRISFDTERNGASVASGSFSLEPS
jgi:acyl-coenzyme A synthetase/AMP-(fatty) acid ligase/3-hydroxymyristoyl/3-hydroxydecanoyl-(acyl carrier protein) dehydratase